MNIQFSKLNFRGPFQSDLESPVFKARIATLSCKPGEGRILKIVRSPGLQQLTSDLEKPIFERRVREIAATMEPTPPIPLSF